MAMTCKSTQKKLKNVTRRVISIHIDILSTISTIQLFES